MVAPVDEVCEEGALLARNLQRGGAVDEVCEEGALLARNLQKGGGG